jgi:hypothetical protein
MSDNGNTTAPNTTSAATIVTALGPVTNTEDDSFDPGCLDREDSDGDSNSKMELGDGEERNRDATIFVEDHQDGTVGYTGDLDYGGTSEPLGGKGRKAEEIDGRGGVDPNLKTVEKNIEKDGAASHPGNRGRFPETAGRKNLWLQAAIQCNQGTACKAE